MGGDGAADGHRQNSLQSMTFLEAELPVDLPSLKRVLSSCHNYLLSFQLCLFWCVEMASGPCAVPGL